MKSEIARRTFAFCLGLLSLTSASEVGAQVVPSHGTYYLAEFSPDYTVVAIDSRETRAGLVDDTYCKIRPLSARAFFFASGATSARDTATQTLLFDARDLASSIYSRHESAASSAKQMAAEWAAEMKRFYAAHPIDFASLAASDGTMAVGFFVNQDASGSVTFGGQTITYLRGSFFSTDFVIPPTIGGQRPVFFEGHRDIIAQFFGAPDATQRALELKSTLPAQAGPDGDAARFWAYVGAVRDWSDDRGIGGEIATVVSERGRGWRWYHRPSFCPEGPK